MKISYVTGTVIFVFVLLISSVSVLAVSMSGFILDDALIPKAEVFYGGPSKDGIPSLDDPKFVKASQAHFLRDTD